VGIEENKHEESSISGKVREAPPAGKTKEVEGFSHMVLGGMGGMQLRGWIQGFIRGEWGTVDLLSCCDTWKR